MKLPKEGSPAAALDVVGAAPVFLPPAATEPSEISLFASTGDSSPVIFWPATVRVTEPTRQEGCLLNTAAFGPCWPQLANANFPKSTGKSPHLPFAGGLMSSATMATLKQIPFRLLLTVGALGCAAVLMGAACGPSEQAPADPGSRRRPLLPGARRLPGPPTPAPASRPKPPIPACTPACPGT